MNTTPQHPIDWQTRCLEAEKKQQNELQASMKLEDALTKTVAQLTKERDELKKDLDLAYKVRDMWRD